MAFHTYDTGLLIIVILLELMQYTPTGNIIP